MAHRLIKKQKVAVIGGINMDIWGRPREELLHKDSAPGYVVLSPGGVGRNIAHNLKLLGLDVSLAAALGEDPNGSILKAHCVSLGIDMSFSPVITGRNSSSYLYISNSDGDMEYAINEMDICSELSAEYLAGILPQLEDCSAIVLDANLSAEAISYICENTSLPIYADPVSAVKGEKFMSVLPRLRAFKPNRLEAQLLSGENDIEAAARKLVDMGVEKVFISLGAEGMLAADKNEVITVPAVNTEVVNCCGAGDAASSAIVWADLQGMSLRDIAWSAMLAGSITCRSDKPNAPELSALADLL